MSIIESQNPDRYDEIFIKFGDEFRDGLTFFSNFITDDVDLPVLDAELPAAGTAASLRVAYNGTTKVFSLSVDRSGSANGYQWETLASYGIAGSGGERNTDWKMDSGRVAGQSIFQNAS